jgi:hypothetical protein
MFSANFLTDLLLVSLTLRKTPSADINISILRSSRPLPVSVFATLNFFNKIFNKIFLVKFLLNFFFYFLFTLFIFAIKLTNFARILLYSSLSNKIIPRNLALVSNVIKSFSYSMA